VPQGTRARLRLRRSPQFAAHAEERQQGLDTSGSPICLDCFCWGGWQGSIAMLVPHRQGKSAAAESSICSWAPYNCEGWCWGSGRASLDHCLGLCPAMCGGFAGLHYSGQQEHLKTGVHNRPVQAHDFWVRMLPILHPCTSTAPTLMQIWLQQWQQPLCSCMWLRGLLRSCSFGARGGGVCQIFSRFHKTF
jgi:hypothetical protein